MSSPSSDGASAGDPDRRGRLRIAGCTRCFAGAGGEEIRAVDDLSVDIGAGQIVSIVGSNGAGKSTLLSLIAGVVLPDTGQVLIDEVDYTLRPSWQRASSVQRVRQNPAENVIGSLTIEENFALVLPDPHRFNLRRKPRARRRAAAAAALLPFEMGLENRLGTMADELSGGQRQAVAVAMATVARPAVLLLDEHIAALDPKAGRLVMEATEQIIREAGTTTLIVTHDMSHALAQSDRLLMMHRGRIVLDLSGDEKSTLSVTDLVELFEQQSGDIVPDRTRLA